MFRRCILNYRTISYAKAECSVCDGSEYSDDSNLTTAKAPNPLQSISQIIKNVFSLRCVLLLAQVRCTRLRVSVDSHNAASASVEPTPNDNNNTKKRCKSRYCTDFVTWILKRQIFYVTEIFLVANTQFIRRRASCHTGRFRSTFQRCTIERFPAGILGTLGSRGRYGIYVPIEFMDYIHSTAYSIFC